MRQRKNNNLENIGLIDQIDGSLWLFWIKARSGLLVEISGMQNKWVHENSAIEQLEN